MQTRIIELAEMVIEASRSKSKIEFASRRPWDNSVHRQADISRARSILDFKPSVNLSEGIEQAVAWFQRNKAKIEFVMRSMQ